MVDEQEPAKRVVKRVVKKTVVRPPAQVEAPPTIRYGRPVATAARPQAKVQSASLRTSSGKSTTVAKPTTARSAPVTRAPRQRPSIDLAGKISGARHVGGRVWWAAADGVSDAARTSGSFIATRVRTVAGWRLPHINLYLAAVITGVVAGLASVVLGVSALAIFAQVRGVSSGGGLWGGLTFTAVAVVAVLVGEALMRGFGSRAARLTSFLAVMLTIIAMLGLFLDVVDTTAGLALVPLLGVVAFALSQWLVDLAESAPSVVE